MARGFPFRLETGTARRLLLVEIIRPPDDGRCVKAASSSRRGIEHGSLPVLPACQSDWTLRSASRIAQETAGDGLRLLG